MMPIGLFIVSGMIPLKYFHAVVIMIIKPTKWGLLH